MTNRAKLRVVRAVHRALLEAVIDQKRRVRAERLLARPIAPMERSRFKLHGKWHAFMFRRLLRARQELASSLASARR